MLSLEEYRVNFKYIKSIDNTLEDTLSRYPTEPVTYIESEENLLEILEVEPLKEENEFPLSMEALREEKICERRKSDAFKNTTY